MGPVGESVRRASRSLLARLTQTQRLLPGAAAAPEVCGPGGFYVVSPLWAPVGSERPARLARFSRTAAGARVGSRVVPVPSFPAPGPVFLNPDVSRFVFSLAGPRRIPPFRPPSAEGGGRGRLCAVVSTREFAHTRNSDTTLSGGSLGSCVDEERS